MYYLNPLSRPVLITPDEVIKQAPAEQTLDPKKVLSAIEIAEERFVRTFLGWDLYELIVNAKNTLVTSGNQSTLQGYIDTTYGAGNVSLVEGNYVNAYDTLTTAYKSLWNNRLWKFVAECVRFVAMPETYALFTSQGIMKMSPTISAGAGAAQASSVSLADLKFLMDKWMGDRIETLQDALHEYIGRNIGDFPSYIRAGEFNTNTNNTCADQSGNATSSRKVGWMTDIYDDNEKHGCTWEGWPTS